MDNLRVGKPSAAELSELGPGHPVCPLRPASQNFQPDFLDRYLQCSIEELISHRATETRRCMRMRSQLRLTWLRLSGMKLGYLLIFGAPLMKDGITRIIHGQL